MNIVACVVYVRPTSHPASPRYPVVGVDIVGVDALLHALRPPVGALARDLHVHQVQAVGVAGVVACNLMSVVISPVITLFSVNLSFPFRGVCRTNIVVVATPKYIPRRRSSLNIPSSILI